VIVLVANPTKTSELSDLLRVVERLADEPVELRETTPEDEGEGLARAAVADGARLVLAAGGDGTVQAVACGLAGSGVPLGVVPLGTGNLLARNLGLPLDRGDAVAVALGGRDRSIDLGSVQLDERPPTHFAVMAGLGFDAEMMSDAPAGLKSAVGWPAYVVSGLQHLRDRPHAVELMVDGSATLRLLVRGIVVGNVGQLQAGVALLPDAVPDDGVLDVVALAPRHLADWGRVVLRLVTRSTRYDPALRRWTARSIELRSAVPIQAQLDGEPSGAIRRLRLAVEPAALVMR